MVCVTYDYYSCNYGGSVIPREVFDGFARRASVLLESMLRKKPKDEEQETTKRVLCEICDRLYREDRHHGVKAESVDGYQVTYMDNVLDSEILRLVRRNFGDSGILYRGR